MLDRQNESMSNVVRKEQKRLFGFIRKQVASSEDAEDILQDVFYQMTSSFREAVEIEQMSAWLFRVARNKIIDWYRKKKTTSMASIQVPANTADEEPLTLAEILPDMDSIDTPEAALMRNMIWEALDEALDMLPEDQREVFTMHEFDDLSFKQIAELTGENINTLLSRKRYAVLFIREQLQELYTETIKNL